MNTQNLTPEEVKVLHALLGKMIDEPKPKIYFDPINGMIDNILENFKFERVQIAMEATGWRYADSEGKDVTIDKLKETAIYCLKGAAKARLDDYIDEHWEQGIILATGGFQAMAFCDQDKTKITALDLKFIMADWDCELEDVIEKI